MIESGVTFDFGQLVMDNEFARMIKYAVAGIPVDDDSLAVEDIAKVGAFGDFLSLDATLKHMRELSQPVILDRRVREDWEARGSQDLATRGAGASPRAHRDARAHAARPGHGQADPRHHRGRRSRERCGMKDPAQAGRDRRQHGHRPGPHPGADRHRGPGPGGPRRRPAARHGGRRRAHARGRDLHPRGAALRPGDAGLPRPAAPAHGGRRGGRHGHGRARHRRGRPARHRQEPRRHDAAGRRLHGRQPRHRGDERAVRRRGAASTRRRSSA